MAPPGIWPNSVTSLEGGLMVVTKNQVLTLINLQKFSKEMGEPVCMETSQKYSISQAFVEERLDADT